MKKKRLLIIFSILFLIVACFGIFYNIESKSYKDEDSSSSTIQIKEEDTLSMMLETAYESGEYKQVTQSSWPDKGYTFNATLSKCENGSELSWDDEQKLVYFAWRNPRK